MDERPGIEKKKAALILYMLSVTATGALSATAVIQMDSLPAFNTSLLYTVLGFIGYHFIVKMPAGNRISIGDPVIIAAVWCYGSALALLAVIPAALLHALMRKTSFLNCLFNCGQIAVIVTATGVVASPLKSRGHLYDIIGIFLAIAVYDTVNILLISAAHSLDGGKSLSWLFKSNFYLNRRSLLIRSYVINMASGLLAGYMGDVGLIFVFLGMLAILAQSQFEQELNVKDLETKTDPLTGLNNVRCLDGWLANTYGPSKKAPYSVIFVDVDNLKRINDDFGHSSGDDVLIRVSGLLKSAVRKSDTVIRYGGDEFVIICEGVTHREACKVAHRILKSMSDAVLSEDDVPFGISLGVASYPDHGETGSDLIRISDKAMYIAKKLGGNTAFSADRL